MDGIIVLNDIVLSDFQENGFVVIENLIDLENLIYYVY
jgi:hypothetical protein